MMYFRVTTALLNEFMFLKVTKSEHYFMVYGDHKLTARASDLPFSFPEHFIPFLQFFFSEQNLNKR